MPTHEVEEEGEEVSMVTEEPSFVRLLEPEEDHNLWKMVLFVAMVVIGVMMINSTGSAEI